MIAAILGLAELAALDFTLLMLAAGALAAAGVAAFVRDVVAADRLGVAAAAMLGAIRPMIVRKLITAPS